MDVADVMDELGSALETIEGLRVFPYYASSITPPAAFILWPDTYQYDSTMARGSDQVTFPVTVVVGKGDARTTRDRLTQYVDGSGADSVKAVIESHTPTSYDEAHVTRVEFGEVVSAGTTYLGATFYVDIIGRGA